MLFSSRFSFFFVSVALAFFTLALFTGMYVFAWAPPTVAPPANNAAAPLNVSSTGQTKAGGLILNTGGATNGLIVDRGRVGIGTVNPSERLEVIGGNIKSDTGFCIGNTCITSWPGATGGGSYVMRSASCRRIGRDSPCTLFLSCPVGESIRSLGWNIVEGTLGNPAENEMAIAAYETLKSISDTGMCIGSNSCTQSATGSSSNSDIWGAMVALCSAGPPPSSALSTGWYGWCKMENVSSGINAGNYCYQSQNPLTCLDGDGNPGTVNDRSCSECPTGYLRVAVSETFRVEGSVGYRTYTYFCYKQ